MHEHYNLKAFSFLLFLQQFVWGTFESSYHPTSKKETYFPSVVLHDRNYPLKIVDIPDIPFISPTSFYNISDLQGKYLLQVIIRITFCLLSISRLPPQNIALIEWLWKHLSTQLGGWQRKKSNGGSSNGMVFKTKRQ